MTRKQNTGANVDSDELQALFDSIASAPAAVPEPPAASPATDSSGDDEELQALFDSVSAGFEASGQGAAAGAARSDAPPAAAVEEAGADSGEDKVFNRIGQMTRQVHEFLRALGSDSSLHEAVLAMPDARQRLNYISQMTEQAASRVLNATDIARPMQERTQQGAQALRTRWDRLFANELSVDEFKALANDTRNFLGEVDTTSQRTGEQLHEIMMAQDFQDLTGQVIKRVVDLAQTLERELLAVLLEVTPPEKLDQKHAGLMNGPVIDAKDRDDVVTTQEQVDDLLDSLGF
ncbi:MAG: protein phosphatase CheZ [Rhodocyclaceae bacterium]|jgi:chemotaxis protein CheZ|nr:protein phosphatase CheZ [Rhodocyclaceae bacterium]